MQRPVWRCVGKVKQKGPLCGVRVGIMLVNERERSVCKRIGHGKPCCWGIPHLIIPYHHPPALLVHQLAVATGARYDPEIPVEAPFPGPMLRPLARMPFPGPVSALSRLAQHLGNCGPV